MAVLLCPLWCWGPPDIVIFGTAASLASLGLAPLIILSLRADAFPGQPNLGISYNPLLVESPIQYPLVWPQVEDEIWLTGKQQLKRKSSKERLASSCFCLTASARGS